MAQSILVNLQELQDNFELVIVPNNKRTGAYEKWGVYNENADGTIDLDIIEGLDDNGVTNAKTLLSHWYFDGFIWGKKSQQRLIKENEINRKYLKDQDFNIWTSTDKYCKIVNGKVIYLENDSDIYDFGAEILNQNSEKFNTNEEILNEHGQSFEPKKYASFEPKQFNSYDPKQFVKTIKVGVCNAYEVNESQIRPIQLAEILARYE